MVSEKQRAAARENIKKAQAKWQSMTKREHSMAQPEGRKRSKPGATGEGEYFRIVVRPKEQFVSFRNQDVGEPGGLERISGRRSSGSWATQAWLISKQHAHLEGTTLVADSDDAKNLLKTLGSTPLHEKGDIFTAKDRRNVAEKDKPTAAQQKARQENIKTPVATC